MRYNSMALKFGPYERLSKENSLFFERNILGGFLDQCWAEKRECGEKEKMMNWKGYFEKKIYLV